ncbi:hypothetical protein GALL_530530 [mine drainage metagenome]|uniref:Uncharacterized protein n=1 Tax=mine drainage metagenome TaxID=410659 RepID=A0A1J5PD09_9ZZZZ
MLFSTSVVHTHNRWMVQSRRCLRLSTKTRLKRWIPRQVCSKNLDGDHAREATIVSAIDIGHPAAAY